METRGSGPERLLVAWMVVAAAVCLLLLVPGFLDKVALWGHNMPQQGLARDYLAGVVWALLLGLGILVWPVSPRDKPALFLLWGARCLDTLGFMLLVENKYVDMDAWGYFAVSRQGGLHWQFFALGGGTENMYSLARILRLFLPDSYHALKVSFAMIGLVAIYVFYRSAVVYLGHEERRLLYVLGLWPSVLFWSSILGKDPVVLLGIALYAYGAVAWGRWKRPGYLFLIALGTILAMSIRFWLAPLLLVPLAVFLAFSTRGVVSRALLTLAAVAFLSIVTLRSSNLFNIRTEDDLLWAMERMDQVAGGVGGSGQMIPVDLTRPEQAARFLPLGMLTALFRPLPGEVRNAFGWIAGFDDLALLLLAIMAVVRGRWQQWREPAILSGALLVIVWSILYAPISYLNLGMGDRYRCQIMPVFLLVCLYLGWAGAEPPRKVLTRTREPWGGENPTTGNLAEKS